MRTADCEGATMRQSAMIQMNISSSAEEMEHCTRTRSNGALELTRAVHWDSLEQCIGTHLSGAIGEQNKLQQAAVR